MMIETVDAIRRRHMVVKLVGPAKGLFIDIGCGGCNIGRGP
jgi:hypothetical protein